MTNFTSIPGSGVQGVVDNHLVQIGRQYWMEELDIDTEVLQNQKERLEYLGKTVMLTI